MKIDTTGWNRYEDSHQPPHGELVLVYRPGSSGMSLKMFIPKRENFCWGWYPDGMSPHGTYWTPLDRVLAVPFAPGSTIVCLRDTSDVNLHGDAYDMAYCSAGAKYVIDGCVWSYKAGWLVSISGELHRACDFEAVK